MSDAVLFPQHDRLRAMALRRRINVFLVGGFLRNRKLGVPSTDLDFAVSGGAVALARQFAKALRGSFVLLDDAHGSARVVKSQGGTVWTYDFTDLRGPTIQKDLRARDFTVNTFCLDIETLKDCSPPAAARDLKSKIIRMVSARAFVQDPLRLMRAFSLSAQTGFKIEPATLARLRQDSHLIQESAMERTREELFKILESPRAYANVVKLDGIGLLTAIVPQVTVMYGVHQGGYHHLDVWKHSLEALRCLETVCEDLILDPRLKAYLSELIGGGHSRKALLKMGILLHDIGKPQTRKKEGARMTFHGHEHVGQHITRLVAKRLKLSVKERYWLEDAVRLHLRPGYLANFQKPSAKALFRYMRDTGSEAAAIAILAMADQKATRGRLTKPAAAQHHERICRMLVEEFFRDKEKPVVERLLTGHDLIKRLKLKPSPLFGDILTAVTEAQALGRVSTKDEALALAGRMANGKG